MRRAHELQRAAATWSLLAALLCLALVSAAAQSRHFPSIQETALNQGDVQQPLPTISAGDDNPANGDSIQHAMAKQKKSMMRANLEKSKKDAAELAGLARELREALNKPNGGSVSQEVIRRAERIEKLAKKIRNETMGF